MNVILLQLLAGLVLALVLHIAGARPARGLDLRGRYDQLVANGRMAGHLGDASLQRLRDQRAGIWAQMQDIRDSVEANRSKADQADGDGGTGGDGWTAELRAAWDKADADLRSVDERLGREERAAELDKRFDAVETDPDVTGGNRDAGGDDDDKAYRDAFNAYLRFGENGVTAEQRQVLQAASTRAQGVATGSAGGYTVPEGFWAKVTETMKAYSRVEDVAEVITTATGNPLPWPTNDDTGNTGRLLAENTQVTETAVTFGQAQLDAFTFSSDLVLVSLQLLQDSGIDLEPFVARKLGERIGRVENSYFTTGTGSSQPQGYIAGATTGKTTASATAITYDELIDLVHSVDPAYRESPNCRFALHDSVLAYVRKIRDDSGGSGLGRPIWEPSIQAGEPDRLLGYRYFINQAQDSAVTATKKTVAFGDFRAAFVIRRVVGGQLMVLRERYADYLQVGYFGFERADSVTQDASAVKLLVQHS